MTKLFERAIETARQLPPERQDEIARLVLMVAQEDEQIQPLPPEVDRDILKTLEEVSIEDVDAEGQVRHLPSNFG